MFADFDGLADVNRLTIVDVLYGTEKLDMTTDPNDPLKKDPHPNQIRIPIGEAAGTFIVMDPNLNIPIVTLGATAGESLVVSADTGGTMIEIENTVVTQKSSSAYPSRLEFIVQLTDGQMEWAFNPKKNKFEYMPHIIELQLPINPHVTDSTSMWRNRVGVPDIDVTPWVNIQTPKISDRYNAAAKTTESIPFQLSATSATLQDANQTQTVGDTEVSLFDGHLQRQQPLILDGSGGQSELALPA